MKTFPHLSREGVFLQNNYDTNIRMGTNQRMAANKFPNTPAAGLFVAIRIIRTIRIFVSFSYIRIMVGLSTPSDTGGNAICVLFLEKGPLVCRILQLPPLCTPNMMGTSYTPSSGGIQNEKHPSQWGVRCTHHVRS